MRPGAANVTGLRGLGGSGATDGGWAGAGAAYDGCSGLRAKGALMGMRCTGALIGAGTSGAIGDSGSASCSGSGISCRRTIGGAAVAGGFAWEAGRRLRSGTTGLSGGINPGAISGLRAALTGKMAGGSAVVCSSIGIGCGSAALRGVKI